MALNILQICTEALNGTGIDPPGSISGNGDFARQLLAIANATGRDLTKRKEWQQLQTEATFTSQATELQTTILSTWPDFKKMIDRTMFNRTQDERIIGPLSPQAWQRIKADTVIPAEHYFRIFGGKIYFPGDPTAGETIAFEYISNYFAENNAGAAKALFTADSDKPRLPDDLFIFGIKWRFLKEKGFDYGEAFRDYEDQIDYYAGNDQPAENINMNPYSRDEDELSDGYVPERNFPSS